MIASILPAASPATTKAPPCKAVRLTRREREVLEWAAEGKSCWETAVILGISEHTVQFHRKQAAAKVGVEGVIRTVAECLRRGLIA